MDNNYLLRYYEGQYHSAEEESYKVTLATYITELTEVLQNSRSHEHTPFTTPSLPNLPGLLFEVNDWTQRLCYLLPAYLPGCEI